MNKRSLIARYVAVVMFVMAMIGGALAPWTTGGGVGAADRGNVAPAPAAIAP